MEHGNHTVFPVACVQGEAPRVDEEIALFFLCAEEPDLAPGGTLALATVDAPQAYTVCGFYSDITNGGKTAKAACLPDAGTPMWSMEGVTLADNGLAYRCVVSAAGNEKCTTDAATLTVVEKVTPPQTGDASRPLVWVALLAVSLPGMVAVMRCKHA